AGPKPDEPMRSKCHSGVRRIPRRASSRDTLFTIVLVALLTLLVGVPALAQAPQQEPPLAAEPQPQQTPEEAKKEEQEPDTQATASDLAKAVQNPVASLISVPIQNLTDFNIGPYARD